jgi:hypothetical protein
MLLRPTTLQLVEIAEGRSRRSEPRRSRQVVRHFEISDAVRRHPTLST